MQTGDIVKFTDETQEERQFRLDGHIMRIVWVNGQRAMIETDIYQAFAPTSIVLVSSLEVIS